MDWTYSAFIALFFATESKAHEDSGALWAIDEEALSTVFQKRARSLFPYLMKPKKAGPEHLGTIGFPDAFEHDSFGLIAPMLPSFHVSRLASQQGYFLINCNYRMTFEESLADMMKDESGAWLFRITFSQQMCETCLRRLMHWNVHPATLFPDLEGLARFINLKNELFPAVAAKL